MAQEPVAETRTTGAVEVVEPTDFTPPSIELYLADKLPGPCGLSQLPAISFAVGSSTLDEAQNLELGRLARCLTAKPFDGAGLVLVGHADPVGSLNSGEDLAYERAAVVKARLINSGVAPERLIVTAAGPLQRPPDRADQARRVDLLITRPRPTSADGRPPR
jgi:outer membrane protein OmpA-like peptidoglycan-associated protein